MRLLRLRSQWQKEKNRVSPHPSLLFSWKRIKILSTLYLLLTKAQIRFRIAFERNLPKIVRIIRVNVLECAMTGKGERKKARWFWFTNFHVTAENRVVLANGGGRLRWNGEFIGWEFKETLRLYLCDCRATLGGVKDRFFCTWWNWETLFVWKIFLIFSSAGLIPSGAGSFQKNKRIWYSFFKTGVKWRLMNPVRRLNLKNARKWKIFVVRIARRSLIYRDFNV